MPRLARRRLVLAAGSSGLALPAGSVAAPNPADEPAFAPVLPGRPLRFPRDHGAHPEFRTEWWYLTGWLRLAGQPFGVQVTFFRSRTRHPPGNPSRFAPHQLLLAHAAIADPAHGRLRHDQLSARAGFGLAQASQTDTDLSLGRWQLSRDADDRYRTRIEARDFRLALSFTPAAAPQPQGDNGYSRKGPQPAQASHYYSRPRLAVQGEVVIAGRSRAVEQGLAWLDHEWSSEVLDPRAVGWDWVGLNFDDGSALMAFRIRADDGGEIWQHARWLPAGDTAVGATGAPAAGKAGLDRAPAVRFEPLRHWRSSRSAGNYPVAMRLRVGDRTLQLEPLLDDQELDARASTGGHYWEGAVRVFEAGRETGRGYLELTGYAGPLRL
ncbi:MAG: carotenoid 1,2-hydratase [Betaproteobacteria bacterium]|nr:carotenoid 1,2-hydratase [Betaproteobacteria bacterium]